VTTSPRRVEPEQIIFTGLAIILAALAIYFALSSIPSAPRPTLQPTPDSSLSLLAPANP
jgi:hypothetical protein